MKTTLTLLSIVFFNVFLNVAQNPLINYPALSPSGQHIAFNYQGDIWTADITGKNAKRITVHKAYDTRPIWAADGKTIAFQSDRYGNNDIFLIPSNGGIPKRLTYRSATDNLTDFSKNGTILFSSRRDFSQVERGYETLIVNQKGGTPYRYLDALGFDAVESPNGNFIAFTRGGCRAEREAYQGPANKDVWLYNKVQDTYLKLTNFNGQDFSPQWGNNTTLYFQSARSGKYNVHKLTLNESGNVIAPILQITNFKDMGLFSYHISQNNADMVVSQGDKVYLINVNSKAKKEIKLNLATDYRVNPIEHKSYTNAIDELALSPNGNYTAMVIRGEIFVKENNKEKKKVVNVSASSYRDRMVTWLNDSTLIFISDRDGYNNLYLAKSADKNQTNIFKSLKHEVLRLTNSTHQEASPILSPDRKQVAFIKGRGNLVVANIDSTGKLSNKKMLLEGWDTPKGLAWSPDSKWIAYSLNDLEFNSEIYIHKADNSTKPVNISMHPKQDRNPVWSTDGSKLMFSSNRNNSDYDVWFTWLKTEDWEKTPEDWDETTTDTAKKKADNTSEKHKTTNADKIDDIVIDFDNIYERQVQVTSFAGGEFGQFFSKDGKTIYYTTGNGTRGNIDVESDLFKISWEGKDKKALTRNNTALRNLATNTNISQVYYTKKSGSLGVLNLGNDKLEDLSFVAKLDINYPEESKQIFEEAWKAIQAGFYDPNFHGQDWDVLKQQYKPLALKASTRQDFQNIFNWMLGQINASHMGLRNVKQREYTQKEITGLLGVEFVPNADGTLNVVKVVDRMPANRSLSKIQVSDIITAVNGVALTPETNIYSLLQGTSNDKVYLGLIRNNNKTELVIRPQSNNYYENYYTWVKMRKQLTQEYSGGKLGYIHIQGMNWTSFEQFERELTAAGLGKEGVVIDVRFNGGGWTTDYLMSVLNVKQHAYTVPRGAAKNLEKEAVKFQAHYPYSERLPFAAWTKPSVALCNHASYSNAEIFSHAYKTLEIGTLVGEPTFGAVISTGAVSLIDGSYVRMPYRGWYVKGSNLNMELGPAQPDVFILNNPDDKAKNKDTQLKKAVEVLLAQIKAEHKQ